jgi:hypothetical protein
LVRRLSLGLGALLLGQPADVLGLPQVGLSRFHD